MQYLGNRPYVEVANLITALQQEAQASIMASQTIATVEPEAPAAE